MRRRAFLATAGTVALAGCTASGDEGSDEIDFDSYTVVGLENSTVYTGYQLFESESLASVLTFTQDASLGLEYDADADYDPLEHEVLLLEGYDEAESGAPDGGTGEVRSNVVVFDIGDSRMRDGGPYRVVSKDDAGAVVDEFELDIVRKGSDSE